jgi:ankyrin repeat protein
MEGHVEVVAAMLLSNRAHANTKGKSGMTPFMCASREGHLGVVLKLLHALGIQELLERDEYGCTALHHAAWGGHADIAAFLLSKGAQAKSKSKAGTAALMTAASRGHLGVVKALVGHMGGQGLEERGDRGVTALGFAAAGGHEDVMAFLQNSGAKANSKSDTGVTPLMHASWGGHLGVVRKLLGIMGDEALAERDDEGRTALHYAASEGREEMVAPLLAQANVKDQDGETPLMIAASQGHMGVVCRLLQVVRGQGLKERSENGRTALHLACWGGAEEVVRALLLAGADTSVTDNKGMTPRRLAEARGHSKLVAVFEVSSPGA